MPPVVTDPADANSSNRSVATVDYTGFETTTESYSYITAMYADSLLWSYGLIVVSALSFRLIDWLLIKPLVNHYDGHQADHRRWRIRNEVTSLLHASISGVWALAAFLSQPDMFADLMTFYSTWTYGLLLLSTGYLVQDAIDLLLHERSLRVFELQFHHFSIVFAIMCAVITGRYVPIVACGLLMEVNSIFLHSRSLFNLHAVNKTSIKYRLLSVANIGTFIFFRLSVNTFLLVWNFLHYHAMTPFYFGVLFFVMFSLLVVNLILFYRVLLADKFLQPEFGISAGCLMSPWQMVNSQQQQNMAGDGGVTGPNADGSLPDQALASARLSLSAKEEEALDDDAVTFEGLISSCEGAYLTAVRGDGEQDIIP